MYTTLCHEDHLSCRMDLDFGSNLVLLSGIFVKKEVVTGAIPIFPS